MPLETLPVDVIEHILSKLSPLDIIQLSFCSKKWRCLLVSLRIPIDTLYVQMRGLTCTSSDGISNISLGIQLFKRGFVHFFFYKKSYKEQKEMIAEDGRMTTRVFGESVFVCKIDKTTTIKLYSSNPLISFYTVLSDMLSLFPGKIGDFTLGCVGELCDNQTLRLLRMSSIRNCQRIHVPSGGAVTRRLLNSLLSIDHLDKLYQNAMAPADFFWSKPIKVVHLSMPNADWVTLRNMKMMDCVVMDLGSPCVSQKDLNIIINDWLKSDKKKLRRISLSWCTGWSWSANQGATLLEGLPLMSEDPKRRPQFYTDEFSMWRIDCAGGHDIMRNDGRMATIQCDSCQFNFLVWI